MLLNLTIGMVMPFHHRCVGDMHYPTYKPTPVDTAIYLAHLQALWGLCVAIDDIGHGYGLILERDAVQVGRWPIGIGELMELQAKGDALLVLAPSEARPERLRRDIVLGQFVHHGEGYAWGAGANLYQLQNACQKRNLHRLKHNMGCVPWDYATTEVYQFGVVTNPWYFYKFGKSASHSGDYVHRNLKKNYATAISAWVEYEKLHNRTS